jgi:hypothetical protein
MDLERIASRIAIGEPAPEETPGEKKEEIPEDVDIPAEEEIKWNTLPKHQKNLKMLTKDLGIAIADKKNIEMFRIFGEIIDTLGMMAKATNQRSVKTKLDAIEQMFGR